MKKLLLLLFSIILVLCLLIGDIYSLIDIKKIVSIKLPIKEPSIGESADIPQKKPPRHKPHDISLINHLKAIKLGEFILSCKLRTLQAAKDALGILSPSKEHAKLGEFMLSYKLHEISLRSHHKAKAIRELILYYFNLDQSLSVYDVYTLIGMTSVPMDKNYGWRSLFPSDICILRIDDQYLITLPDPILL